MRLREATVEDATAISELIVPLAEEFIASDFNQHARAALLGSMSPQAIQKYILEGYRYQVAENAEGSFAGVVAIRNNAHLYHLFVSKKAQGAGLGRKLWATALSACQARNHTGPITVNSSRFALRFYERLGFLPNGGPDERGGVTSYPLIYTPPA